MTHGNTCPLPTDELHRQLQPLFFAVAFFLNFGRRTQLVLFEHFTLIVCQFVVSKRAPTLCQIFSKFLAILLSKVVEGAVLGLFRPALPPLTSTQGFQKSGSRWPIPEKVVTD